MKGEIQICEVDSIKHMEQNYFLHILGLKKMGWKY